MNESKPNQERSSKQPHGGKPPKSFHFQAELLEGRANQVQRDGYFLKKDKLFRSQDIHGDGLTLISWGVLELMLIYMGFGYTT